MFKFILNKHVGVSCPRCSEEMSLKLCRKGKYTGKYFLLCDNDFCRNIINVHDREDWKMVEDAAILYFTNNNYLPDGVVDK